MTDTQATDTTRIGVICGSIAQDSINQRVTHALIRLAPDGAELTQLDIAGLGHYDRAHDGDYPPAEARFKQQVLDADGIIVVTPEYNRSIPGVLKNAIDWASRPYGENAFTHKPVGIIGASPSPVGTAAAQQHLISILAYCKAYINRDNENYLQYREGTIDEQGEVSDDPVRTLLSDYVTGIVDFVRQVGRSGTP